MTQLANSLFVANHFEDASSVQEAQLSMLRRVGASEGRILCVQGNLATTYQNLGRHEEANRMLRDVYSGYLNLKGKEDSYTLHAANNYAIFLVGLKRFEEARSLVHKTIPIARRVLGKHDESTLKMRWIYAFALYRDTGSTLDDVLEAVTTFEDSARIARRVLGGSHPLTDEIEKELQKARVALRARETPSA